MTRIIPTFVSCKSKSWANWETVILTIRWRKKAKKSQNFKLNRHFPHYTAIEDLRKKHLIEKIGTMLESIYQQIGKEINSKKKAGHNKIRHPHLPNSHALNLNEVATIPYAQHFGLRSNYVTGYNLPTTDVTEPESVRQAKYLEVMNTDRMADFKNRLYFFEQHRSIQRRCRKRWNKH